MGKRQKRTIHRKKKCKHRWRKTKIPADGADNGYVRECTKCYTFERESSE